MGQGRLNNQHFNMYKKMERKGGRSVAGEKKEVDSFD
jgi:hypothetical protein